MYDHADRALNNAFLQHRSRALLALASSCWRLESAMIDLRLLANPLCRRVVIMSNTMKEQR
jgi:hypothetical protein